MLRKVLFLLLVLFVAVGAVVFAGGEQEGGEKVYKVGVIPKFIAEDYFIACENGFRQAESELGNIQVDWVGDPMSTTSAANQKNYIQGFIDRKYDAILVSALDPESFADTLKEAREKGIVVITWDADVNPAARDFFVNQAEFDQIGISVLKGLAGDLAEYKGTGDKAKVAIVTTTTDSPNQNAWIAAIIDEYESKMGSDYDHIDLLTSKDQIVYAGNDQGTADEKIKAMLNANPDVKGIVALSSNTVPAVSSSRDQLGITDEIKIVGISVPETSRKDMEEGKMSAVVLWQPFDLGYLTLYAAYDILTGDPPSGNRFKTPLSGKNMTVSFTDGSTVVNYPGEGHKLLSDDSIILGPPIVWNLRNIDRFRGYPTDDHGMDYFLK